MNKKKFKNIIKISIFRFIRILGIPLIFRKLLQKNSVTIILLHNPEPYKTYKFFSFLDRKYNIISLQDYIFYRYNSREQSKLLPQSLIITFDDGHKNNFFILPILKRLNIKITIFLTAGLINTNKNFWADFEGLTKFQIRNFKNISDTKRIQYLNRRGFDKEKEDGVRRALNKKEIYEMVSYVDFQSHSISHCVLPNCSEEKSLNEISSSKKILEDLICKPINTFSFPFGKYSERELKFLKKTSYKAAITLDAGYNLPKTDIFRLKRVSVDDNANIDELIVKACGFWGYLISFLNKIIQKYDIWYYLPFE